MYLKICIAKCKEINDWSGKIQKNSTSMCYSEQKWFYVLTAFCSQTTSLST
jgi:hypothetical protein